MAKPKTHKLQEVLFPLEEIDVRPPEPTKRPKSEGMATCPAHSGKRETGLVRVGDHLVWRDHTMTTHAKTTRTCWTSGIPICQEGALPREASVWRDPKTGAKPVCPHDRPGFKAVSGG